MNASVKQKDVDDFHRTRAGTKVRNLLCVNHSSVRVR